MIMDPFKPSNTLRRSPPSSAIKSSSIPLPVASTSKITLDGGDPTTDAVSADTLSLLQDEVRRAKAGTQQERDRRQEAEQARDLLNEELAKMSDILDKYEAVNIGALNMHNIAELEIAREALDAEWRMAWAPRGEAAVQVDLAHSQAELALLQLALDRSMLQLENATRALDASESQRRHLQKIIDKQKSSANAVSAVDQRELVALRDQMQTASAAQDKLIAERDEVINRLREQALTDKSSLATLIKELGDARKQLGKLEKEQKKAIKEIDHLKEERSALLEKQETLPDPEAIGAEIDKLAQKHKREVDKLNARVKSVQSALEEKEAENAALIERQEALPDPEAIGKEIDKLDAKHKKELDKLQRQLRTLKEELTEKDGLLKVKSTQHKVVSVMMSKLMEDQGRKDSERAAPQDTNRADSEESDENAANTSEEDQHSTNVKGKGKAGRPKKTATSEKRPKKGQSVTPAAENHIADVAEDTQSRRRSRSPAAKPDSTVEDNKETSDEASEEEQASDEERPTRKSSKGSQNGSRKKAQLKLAKAGKKPNAQTPAEADSTTKPQSKSKRKAATTSASGNQNIEPKTTQPILTVQTASDRATPEAEEAPRPKKKIKLGGPKGAASKLLADPYLGLILSPIKQK